MALAEIMEAKKELVAQRAAERDEKKEDKHQLDTKPELIQTATQEKKTVPVSKPVIAAA